MPSKSTKKSHTELFLDILDNLDSTLSQSVVFLNLKSALQYSRFMNTRHMILRAFVSEVAIDGYSYGLAIKKNSVRKTQIHGYLPGWIKTTQYMDNPVFDKRYQERTVEQPMLW